jgi:hypothetical protein
MRLAYYIAAHTNIEQFRWTFSSVHNDADVFAIHIDRKAGRPFRDAVNAAVKGRNVQLIPSQSVAWGGWSQCRAELEGLRTLLSMNNEWSYYINLSGQCYPIKPITTIRDYLIQLWPKNFIGIGAFSTVRKTEPNDPHLKRRVVFEFAGKIRHTGLCWPTHPQVNWKGSSWHILSRPFCEWIINSGVLDSIPRSIKYTFASDELLFQTLIMQSPFRNEIADHHGRQIIWPGPKTLTLEDWPILSKSSALFARKFNCHKDEQILRKLSESNSLNLPET